MSNSSRSTSLSTESIESIGALRFWPDPCALVDADLMVQATNTGWDRRGGAGPGAGLTEALCAAEGFTPALASGVTALVRTLQSDKLTVARDELPWPDAAVERRLEVTVVATEAGTLVSWRILTTERPLSMDNETERLESRVRRVVEQLPAVMWTTDRDLLFTTSAGAGLESLGLKPDEVVGVSLFEYFQTDDPSFVPIDIHRRALNGESNRYELQWADRIYQSFVEPLRNSRGEIAGTIGIALDVTEQHEAIEALRHSERNYRELFDAASDAIFVHHAETGAVLDVNKAMLETFGYTYDEALRLSVADVSAGESGFTGEVGEERIRHAMQSHEPLLFEWHARHCDGSTFWVEVSLKTALIAGENRILAIVRDIDARKQAEERLRRTESRLATVLDHLPDVVLYETGGGREWMSENIVNLTGYTAEELAADRTLFPRLIDPNDVELTRAAVREWHQRGEPGVLFIQFRIHRRDGRVIWVEDRLAYVRPDDGPPYMAGILIDITQRRADERRLLFQATLLDSVRESIVATDLQGFVVYWSKGAEQLYRHSASHAIGRPITELIVGPEDIDAERKRMDSVLSSGRWSGIYEQRRADGSAFWAETVISLVSDEHGRPTGFVGIDRDITERIEAESALRQGANEYRRIANSRQLLLDELNHRVKNNLAGLLSLVSMIESTARTPEEFAESVRGRLVAMNAAHEILSGAGWEAIDLRALLSELAGQFDAGAQGPSRLRLDGPSTLVAPQHASALAIIVQELFTNSRKHGALRTDRDGAIFFEWLILEESEELTRTRLIWRETGVDEIEQPQVRGLGLRLIEGFTRFELGGQCEFSFEPPGFKCVIECSLVRPEKSATESPTGRA
ncbi:MAG: PAS domain S-box protein [Phycisphaerales bacterium]